jgi:hypothetical protein
MSTSSDDAGDGHNILSRIVGHRLEPEIGSERAGAAQADGVSVRSQIDAALRWLGGSRTFRT